MCACRLKSRTDSTTVENRPPQIARAPSVKVGWCPRSSVFRRRQIESTAVEFPDLVAPLEGNRQQFNPTVGRFACIPSRQPIDTVEYLADRSKVAALREVE
jgi:hypothetical protein